jgi:16S rRNA (adenine1518-N6/adenine1519-N6)-dimethyltransferase
VIKAKKSLGQNFLIDKNVLEKIVSLIKIENKSILEVGPGTGNLTSCILKNNPKKLIVVEKDKYLARLLKKKFETNVVVINEDILKIDENKLHEDKLIVFGNLPYNISTEILAKWVLNLDNKNFWFDSLILMFQKEVADRIISKFNSSKYGRLTILAKWKLDIVKICDIKAESFSPRPKINSSLLFFRPKKNFYKFHNSKNLEKITRVFFNQRRKKIKTPFNILFNGNVNVIKNLRIDLNLRPHNLKEEIYYELTQEYEKL